MHDRPIATASTEAGSSDAQFRRRRELVETAARGRPGGVFYLLGWLVVAYCGDLHRTHLLLASALLALFVLLAAARFVLARRTTIEPAAIARLLAAWWTLLLTTAAIWGVITLWVFIDPQLAGARMAALVCTVAYATAFVHSFATRWHYALAGVAVLFLPSVVLSWTLPGFGGVAFALSVFLVYLLSALRLSRQQYERQLMLELALLHQRDLYEKQSRTDALTALANRREFTFSLERALDSGAPLSLLMIDIDHFKQINDRYGHAAGDAVLIAFADQLRAHFGQPDAHLARLGGEEFGVLLRGVEEDAANAAARALCQRLARAPLAPDAQRGAVTVSIGVGERRRSRHRSGDEFLADVDRALYRAKAQGRDQVCRIA
jgi:diguanylate cyclase